MTGLDPETCHILEVACIITDQHLNTVAEGPNLILHQSDSVLLNMNEWSWKHHTQVNSCLFIFKFTLFFRVRE